MLKFSARDRLRLMGGAAALLASGCGGSSSSTPSAPPPPTSVTPPPPPPPPPPAGQASLTEGMLRDTFRSDFKFGTALTSFQIDDNNVSAQLAASQFNSITPEFQLKAADVAPTEGVFNFERADRIVDWAIANGMDVRGHTLLWHESTPAYFLQGSRNEIRARVETYISTVVDHFKDRINLWDVVNEVVSVDIFNGDQGVGPDRETAWFEAVGNADYVDWAFLAARQADPAAKLFINEYDTDNALKQGWLIDILRRLQDRNVPIDGVAHQFHRRLGDVPANVLQAIDAIDNEFMGLENQVTELDVSCYTDPGSCWESETNCDADLGLEAPVALLAQQAEFMRDLINGLRQRPSVTSVTVWGVRDSDSWLNTTPTTRTNYPLLFDRDGEPKPAFWAIVDPDYVIPGA